MRILITGGSGFVGSNLVRSLIDRPGLSLVNLDKLTYSGNTTTLLEFEGHARYRFVRGCVTDANLVRGLVRDCDAVIHLAAESHVDRSIRDARPFVQTNILGTQTLIDALRDDPAGRDKPLVQVSTDEVFGDLPLGAVDLRFDERSPYAPSSPYAASKAGGDWLALAAHRTFGLDVRVTHSANNFGPFQHPEKLIPRFVTRLLRGRKVPLYGDGQHVRDWLHVADHCAGLWAVLQRGRAGERYCFGAENERSNVELTRCLLAELGLGEEMIERVPDRPGHDRRYAIDPGKARRDLGWEARHSAWPDGLRATVDWYREHSAWWEPLIEE